MEHGGRATSHYKEMTVRSTLTRGCPPGQQIKQGDSSFFLSFSCFVLEGSLSLSLVPLDDSRAAIIFTGRDHAPRAGLPCRPSLGIEISLRAYTVDRLFCWRLYGIRVGCIARSSFHHHPSQSGPSLVCPSASVSWQPRPACGSCTCAVEREGMMEKRGDGGDRRVYYFIIF